MNDYVEYTDKISVVVPCYNSEKYLNDCVDSIIKQTYHNIEIVLVDDCSVDGTKQILEKYEKEDERVKIVYHEQNIVCF